MQRLFDRLFFSPSDLNHFVECEHLTTLDLLAVDGARRRRGDRSAGGDHPRQGARARTACSSNRCAAEGRQITTIAARRRGRLGRRRRAHGSSDARRRRGHLPGRVRRRRPGAVSPTSSSASTRPSALGAWSYEAWDTKLARHAEAVFHPAAVLVHRTAGAAAGRRRRIACTSCSAPASTVSFAPSDFFAYYRAVRARFLRAVDERRADLSAAGRPLRRLRLRRALRRTSAPPTIISAWWPGMRRDQVGRLDAAGVGDGGACWPASIRPRLPASCRRRSTACAPGARCSVRRARAAHHYELLAPEREARLRAAAGAVAGRHLLRHRGLSVLRVVARPRVSLGRRHRARRAAGRSSRSSASTARARSGRSSSSSISSTPACAVSRPARLPLRRLRAERDQAADGRARDARGARSTTCCAAACSSISIRSSGSRCRSRYDSYSLKTGPRVLHDRRRRRARSRRAASRSSSSSASSRPATPRFWTPSATTTPRTANRRACCATGCWSARPRPSSQFATPFPGLAVSR